MWRPILSLVLGLVAVLVSSFAVWGMFVALFTETSAQAEFVGLVFWFFILLWLGSWIPALLARQSLGKVVESPAWAKAGIILGLSPGLAAIGGIAYSVLFVVWSAISKR